jgi:hypothetical protein
MLPHINGITGPLHWNTPRLEDVKKMIFGTREIRAQKKSRLNAL